VSFRNTVIIMTSNIGSPHLIEGVTERGEITESARRQVMGELRQHFRPEFLNRVDEIVLFKPLRLDEIEQIVDLLVRDLQRRLEDRHVTLELTPQARALIAREGFDPVYGARPLRRFIQREVETRIARELIASPALGPAVVRVRAEGDRLQVDIEPEKPEVS
jgi:ATP-dependent Clp protease ATP-binding subunit ClpB